MTKKLTRKLKYAEEELSKFKSNYGDLLSDLNNLEYKIQTSGTKTIEKLRRKIKRLDTDYATKEKEYKIRIEELLLEKENESKLESNHKISFILSEISDLRDKIASTEESNRQIVHRLFQCNNK